jgi:hypothetical protein
VSLCFGPCSPGGRTGNEVACFLGSSLGTLHNFSVCDVGLNTCGGYAAQCQQIRKTSNRESLLFFSVLPPEVQRPKHVFMHPFLLTIRPCRSSAVRRWLPTAAARVRVRAACGICGGQSGTGAGFLRVLRFSLPIVPPIFVHYHNHPGLTQ